MKNIRIAIMYGMGGAAAEYWTTGERKLVTMFKALGVDTGESPYMPEDRQAIYTFLRGYAGKVAIIGDSLGANNGPLYASDLIHQHVDFLGGFQPSIYGQGVDPVTHVIQVPANVLKGMCIWDPIFADTGGLGNAHWQARPGIDVLERRGAHPDDWGTSQEIMFVAAKKALGV